MSTVRDEHLLLPSPLGLLEYDILEDAVFLGPAGKGGLEARPTPFPQAQIAITREAAGFVLRALPGALDVQHNGEAPNGLPLSDGDRVRLADQVAMFRSSRGPLDAPAPAPRAEPSARRLAPAPKRARDPLLLGASLLGALILLLAIAQAVGYLKEVQQARLETKDIPALERPIDSDGSRPERELRELLSWASDNPEQTQASIERLREFSERMQGWPQAEVAIERIREEASRAAARELVKTERTVQERVAQRDFDGALKALRAFEAEYGAMEQGAPVLALRQSVRAQARAALDEVIKHAGPLIQRQPKEAHRLLLQAGRDFPADLAAELTTLLERAVSRMMALSRPTPGTQKPAAEPPAKPPVKDPGRGPGFRTPDKENPLHPVPQDPGPAQPTNPATADPLGADPLGAATAERAAHDAWMAAYAELKAGRYPDALNAYTLLIQQHGNTELFRLSRRKIQAGRQAARAGVEGAGALLSVPATSKKGRLEVAYEFNQPEEYESDFTAEQPFSSELPFEASWQSGEVLLRHATGVLHRIVFDADVRIEATVRVQAPTDLGLLAVQDSVDYRALVFTLANTRFALKKGAAARVNPGHVLWYIGQGVWRDADADVHGFIKIAERGTSKLEGGDRLQIELERRAERCSVAFTGKSDGVQLEGRVRGDDGSTMGPARVGVFTNGTTLILESVRISGVVNTAWFARELALLVRTCEPEEAR